MSVYAIRHGETEWSLNGRHTGVTDLPLTDNGRRLAGSLKAALGSRPFAVVMVSPMQRARVTCELAGLGETAIVEPDLMEWNYGDYEGLTPAQIHAERPGWMVFRDGCPGGESPAQVGARGRGRRRPLRPRPHPARPRRPLDRPASRGRPAIPPGHRHPLRPLRLPRLPRHRSLERSAGGLTRVRYGSG